MKKNIKIKSTLSKLGIFPELDKGQDAYVTITVDDDSEVYKYLCMNSKIDSWDFVSTEEPANEIENLTEANIFESSQEDSVKKDFDRVGINMKDIRDIIMISYAYFRCWKMGYRDYKKLIEYYLVNKESLRSKVYSVEFITKTLEALSTTIKNPLEDFIDRINKTPISDGMTFEDFYKKLYDSKK